jgi:hypothetical protein
MSFFAPNVENYTLGKGVPFFSRLISPGVFDAERDLGNAPTFSINVDIENLEHFSSRSGINRKDLEVVSQISPNVSFTLDEINADNLELIFLGTSVEETQALADPFLVTLTAVIEDPAEGERFYDLLHRKVGVNVLNFTAASGPFTAGETITGTTSTATAVMIEEHIVGSAMHINTIVGGPFDPSETITGGSSAATATTVGAEVFDTSEMVVLEAATRLVKGDDYIIDSNTGRIRILSPTVNMVGPFPSTITVEGSALANVVTVIRGYTDTQIEGFLRFVSDNEVGTNLEAKMWRVKLAPDGEVALIGDDFSTLTFTGEMLDDAINHPDAPFMEVRVDDEGN